MPCKHCERQFFTHSDLARHEATHTTHYHIWHHPDNGSRNGKTSAMFRRPRVFNSRKYAYKVGRKQEPFFAGVHRCQEIHDAGERAS